LMNLQADTPSCFEAEKAEVVAARVSPSVVRSTSGVSSEDESNSHPRCITSSADIIAESLDSVGALVHQFIAKVVGPHANYKLPQSGSRITLGSSPYLDHIHLYTADPQIVDEPTASLHTDNGFFLLATPSKEAPLHVLDSQGQMLTSITSEVGVVVLFGRALDEWLLASKTEAVFRPAPHSVPALKASKQRVIFARMYVAPQEALPYFGKGTNFGDFFMGHNPSSSMRSNLCPRASNVNMDESALLWRKARSTLCEEGFQYCWMSCLPIDTSCPVDQQTCTSDSQKPCCVEGQTAADGCLDMDFSCSWHC